MGGAVMVGTLDIRDPGIFREYPGVVYAAERTELSPYDSSLFRFQDDVADIIRLFRRQVTQRGSQKVCQLLG
jgi:hypothetical protein